MRSVMWYLQIAEITEAGVTTADGQEHRWPVRAGVGMGARSADRAPVADLRIADPAGGLVDDRPGLGQALVLVDPTMGSSAADPEIVVRPSDAVETGDVAKVDEQGRRGESQLEEGKEAVPAREELGLALALGEDAQRAIEVGRPDVIEGCGNHARPSSSAPGVGRSRPGASACAGR